MKRILSLSICCLFSILWWSCQPTATTSDTHSDAEQHGITPTDSLILLENDQLVLKIEQYGGHFTNIELKSNPINPLTWELTNEQMPPNNQKGAPFKGHFLCLGRWGGPSEGEIAAGIPHNGEQSNTLWTISELNETVVQMENDAPLDGLSVHRKVSLVGQQSAFLVKETFTNTQSLGRVSNVVQHITIGPPFLSAKTLFNANAKQGFNQKFSYPNPHAYAYNWPHAIVDTTSKRTNDLRTNQVPDNFVSTHLFDMSDEYGWVTAYDPDSGNLLAYIWKLAEYPWINIWSHFEEDQPFAKGLEFGTTGIGRPYQSLLETDTRFHGFNSWEYMDAGEEKEKTYVGLMLNLGKGQDNPTMTITQSDILLNGKKVLDNPL